MVIAMRLPVEDRLRAERRLLAVLFRWPSECNLEPSHFLSPAHGWLYQAIQEVKRDPVSDDVLASSFDDIALAEIALWLMDQNLDRLFTGEGGFYAFAARYLQNSYDERVDIPGLVAAVRECPRCGR